MAGLGIAEEILDRHIILDKRCDHRGTAHTAADIEGRAQLAVAIDQMDADIVEAHRRTVFIRSNDGNLELAWKVAEFGVESAPLAQ